jgi:Zn-dependent membrane protease YugP
MPDTPTLLLHSWAAAALVLVLQAALPPALRQLYTLASRALVRRRPGALPATGRDFLRELTAGEALEILTSPSADLDIARPLPGVLQLSLANTRGRHVGAWAVAAHELAHARRPPTRERAASLARQLRGFAAVTGSALLAGAALMGPAGGVAAGLGLLALALACDALLLLEELAASAGALATLRRAGLDAGQRRRAAGVLALGAAAHLSGAAPRLWLVASAPALAALAPLLAGGVALGGLGVAAAGGLSLLLLVHGVRYLARGEPADPAAGVRRLLTDRLWEGAVLALLWLVWDQSAAEGYRWAALLAWLPASASLLGLALMLLSALSAGLLLTPLGERLLAWTLIEGIEDPRGDLDAVEEQRYRDDRRWAWRWRLGAAQHLAYLPLLVSLGWLLLR